MLLNTLQYTEQPPQPRGLLPQTQVLRNPDLNGSLLQKQVSLLSPLLFHRRCPRQQGNRRVFVSEVPLLRKCTEESFGGQAALGGAPLLSHLLAM